MNQPTCRKIVIVIAALNAACWPLAAANATDALPIAGLTPDRRPAAAPRMTAETPIDRARALHGVSLPAPASLRFLDNQGGWYNPFLHPGMPGPYDLRGWHPNSTSPGRQ